MDKLAVEDTGAFGVGGQEPDDKGNLQLKIKREPRDQKADRIGSEEGGDTGKNTRGTRSEPLCVMDRTLGEVDQTGMRTENNKYHLKGSIDVFPKAFYFSIE